MKDIVIQMAEFFKALSDPTRLRIIRLLASNPERKLCVGALAHKLGISQPAVSQHLKVLKHVDIVEPNREGFRVHYAINPETFVTFRKNLDELGKLAFEKLPCDDECLGHNE